MTWTEISRLTVSNRGAVVIQRARIDSIGWLVRSYTETIDENNEIDLVVAVSLTFVPDVAGTWQA
jgi:hypothetical protein